MATPQEAAEVVAFWRNAGMERWFSKDEAFDRTFRERFLDLHFQAARRELDRWMGNAEGALALMILLDQFPRNCFRGTGHMFATDSLALSLARRATEAGFDRQVDPDLQIFFYLPYMHSEDLADQDAAVRHCRDLSERVRESAAEHREIIARFGRFPHRNPQLGRETSADEHDFLKGGGFSG